MRRRPHDLRHVVLHSHERLRCAVRYLLSAGHSFVCLFPSLLVSGLSPVFSRLSGLQFLGCTSTHVFFHTCDEFNPMGEE